MLIRIIAVGNKMPSWIEAGFEEYSKRIPKNSLKLELIELSPSRKTDPNEIIHQESDLIARKLNRDHRFILMDIDGKAPSSVEIANTLRELQESNLNLDLVIGGSMGVSAALKDKAHSRWSLGLITLPHMLVRVILAEQIYRAWSILNRHPYHK